MLYVTTRISHDAFTSFRALSENRGPEGGFFVPMQFPYYDQNQIDALAQKSFSENVTQILNLFFGTNMDGRNLEFAIGRYPVKLVDLNGRITVAKTWHNPVYRFERLVCSVEKAIRQTNQIDSMPSDWLMIAARIGVLFGIFGLILQKGTFPKRHKLEIALPSGDLSLLMAAWYARKMGLPIGTIICCCNENASLWTLFHKGELRTNALAFHTHTPTCDCVVPTDLERLIFSTLGRTETERFCESCRKGSTYSLDQEQLEHLREGIHISVISSKRMASTIPNLYKTTGYIADPYTALSYSGLVDYRATTGAGHPALIVSEESPSFSLQFVAECVGMTPEELLDRLK